MTKRQRDRGCNEMRAEEGEELSTTAIRVRQRGKTNVVKYKWEAKSRKWRKGNQ